MMKCNYLSDETRDGDKIYLFYYVGSFISEAPLSICSHHSLTTPSDVIVFKFGLNSAMQLCTENFTHT